MQQPTGTDRLKAYEVYVQNDSALVESIFRVVLIVVLAACVGVGLFFRTVKPLRVNLENEVRRLKASFLVQEKPAPRQKPVVKRKKKPKPVDLTKSPELKSNDDDVQEKPAVQKPVRRVYGVRKVYSRGLGEGGSLADAVVGKLGNTLNKGFDTLTASETDLKGQVVSVTTITTPPRFKKQVKPAYTREMIDAGIEGTIKVRVLVDIDGLVKSAKAMNDLGFGSAARAVEACYKMEFEPARDAQGPKAVWIMVSIKFVKLG